MLILIYFVTILVECIRMGINVHCLDCSGTNIVIILSEIAVSNSITTIYVPEQSKQCTLYVYPLNKCHSLCGQYTQFKIDDIRKLK